MLHRNPIVLTGAVSTLLIVSTTGAAGDDARDAGSTAAAPSATTRPATHPAPASAATTAPAAAARADAAGRIDLDDRGLPPGLKFDPAWEVTPRQAKAALDANEKATGSAVLIDVREPHEWDLTHIAAKDKLFPRARWPQLPAHLAGHENDEVIVYCRSGNRSLQVAKLLRQNGFTKAKSMAGGILLWNKDVNPGGPQY